MSVTFHTTQILAEPLNILFEIKASFVASDSPRYPFEKERERQDKDTREEFRSAFLSSTDPLGNAKSKKKLLLLRSVFSRNLGSTKTFRNRALGDSELWRLHLRRTLPPLPYTFPSIIFHHIYRQSSERPTYAVTLVPDKGVGRSLAQNSQA